MSCVTPAAVFAFTFWLLEIVIGMPDAPSFHRHFRISAATHVTCTNSADVTSSPGTSDINPLSEATMQLTSEPEKS